MINPKQIKQKAEGNYRQYLTSLITKETIFPHEFSVGKIPQDYLILRDELAQLIKQSKKSIGYGYTLELQSRNTRKNGLQSLPKRIAIETEIDYLKLCKKEKEVAQFKLDLKLIQASFPELTAWLIRYPRKVIDYNNHWKDLIKVCQYFKNNPQPNLYMRELPIEVHTKFIEQNKNIISTLLEAILPDELLVSVEGEKENKFEKRFSLKYQEFQIQMKLLDQELKVKYAFPFTNLSIPLSEFQQLNLEYHNCFITENKVNFSTLPNLKNSFAIWGQGYAIQSLKSVTWLLPCPIFYWGDLDVDGFKILSQLRSYFPQMVSVMMDMETFETFQEFAVADIKTSTFRLSHLTDEEQVVYSYLALNQKRLEQEHITNDYASNILAKINPVSINP